MSTDKELDTLKTFYDEVYYANDQKAPQNYRHLNALAAKFDIGKSHQVLDIACGLGEWLKVCESRGAGVYGIDLSSKAIEFCQKNIPAGEFYAQPAENLPFVTDQFDYVTCLGSLEHFVEPVNAIKEMVRVAKPDAKFILLVPNADFLTRKLKLYAGTNQKDAKEVVRTLDEWQEMFEAAGLETKSRWKDLHVLSWGWITMGGWLRTPVRLLQALALAVWPLKWQYQVYHLCVSRKD